MTDGEAEGDGRSRRRTKVERVADEYGLAGLGADLAAMWTGETEERYSLRQLADYVNEQVLAAAMAEADVDALAGEVENTYRLLTDDGVPAGERTRARARLERAGVDVEGLLTDFVSHQAVHTFLTDRQNVTYEGKSTEERVEGARTTIRRLEGRVESVAENTVERLRSTGDLDVGDTGTFVSLTVVCNDCGRQYGFEELLAEGACACADGA